jgi:hypothetical protein
VRHTLGDRHPLSRRAFDPVSLLETGLYPLDTLFHLRSGVNQSE